MLNVLKLKKGKIIRIEFNTEIFDWNFIYQCRKLNIAWDKVKKVRYIEFTPATLPIDVDKFIAEYKDVFQFFSNHEIENFKKIFLLIINEYFKNNKEKEKKYDLSKYPIDDYQKEAVNFLLNKNLAILADDMGLGKTRETCVYLLEKNLNKNLIITPYSLKTIWKDELIFLGVNENDISIIDNDFIQKKYTIINYEKLKKFEKELQKIKWDVIIFDEAHYLKTKESKRFKISKKIVKECENIICVTGTPIINRPVELWTLLHLIKHPLGMSFVNFTDRYCDRKYVKVTASKGYWNTKGAKNLNELAEKLKNVMIRRLKEDIFLSLPEKKQFVKKFNLNKEFYEKYKNIEEKYKTYIRNEKFFNRMNHLVEINKLRELCSTAKFEIIQNLINNFLKENKKIIIFGFFLNPLKKIYEFNKDKALLITGDVARNERVDIIDKFQNNDKYKIFIGQILTSAFGISLTKANVILFNDLYWNPAIHEQSEDRAHRRNSLHDVEIYYLIFQDTIEEDIYNLIKKKEKIINKIMSKTIDEYKTDSIERELIDIMINKYKNS